LDPDQEHAVFVGVCDAELLPGFAIDERVNPQVSIRVVEFKEKVRFREGNFLPIAVVGPTQGAGGAPEKSGHDGQNNGP
jgi:hypothetical protein